MENERVIQSYVTREDKCFMVSTIERDSSAAMPVPRYNETIVWEYDWYTMKRGNIIHQDDGPRGCIETHFRICRALHKLGCVPAWEKD